MADTKISALTASTVPLAGTEVLPIVQGGVTKQVSVVNLTAGRNVSMSGGTVTSGGVLRSFRPDNGIYTDQYMAAGAGGGYIFNNANGDGFKWQFGSVDQFTIDVNGNFVQKVAAKGVNFAANTPAAGMTSQLLNWYEEGTWTPVLNGFTGTGSTSGTYTRIGRMIHVIAQLVPTTTFATVAGTSKLTGLPFTSLVRFTSSWTFTNVTGGTGYGDDGLYAPTLAANSNFLIASGTYFI